MTNTFLHKEKIDSMDRHAKKVKKISVSSKKQITIPKEYFDVLQIGKEVEMELVDGGLFIRPIYGQRDDFSDLILVDLVKEGYSGDKLVEEFRLRKSRIPYAVNALVEDALENGTSFSEMMKELGDD